MSKIIGLCCLHYGKSYLAYAVEAVLPVCDKVVVLYTPTPSHGTKSQITCPDTRDELYLEAKASDKENKVVFLEGSWANEAEHRNCGLNICKKEGADLVVSFDSDEVWNTESLKEAIPIALKMNCHQIGIDGFINFWQSFNHVCLDHFMPVRLINPNAPFGTEANVKATIYHFSFAQAEDIMRYKFPIHGHKSEIQEDWLDRVFYKWVDGDLDLHPVAKNLWNTIPFDKKKLPKHLHSHTNFEK